MENAVHNSEFGIRNSESAAVSGSPPESRFPNPESRTSQSRACWASRDRAELEQAIWRHLIRDSGLATRDRAVGAQRSFPESRVPSPQSRSRSRNAYAFDLWIAHLALLEEALAVAPIPWRELRADELDGLLLLRAARERFRREYHPCAECGAPVKGKICPRCGAVKGRC